MHAKVSAADRKDGGLRYRVRATCSDLASLSKQVDAAMYDVKRSGKNGHRCYMKSA